MTKDELILDIYEDLKLVYEQSSIEKQDFIFATMSKLMKLKVA